MNILEVLLLVIAAIVLISTFASMLNFAHWTIRVFDFPRLQILSLGIVCLLCFTVICFFDGVSLFSIRTLALALLFVAVIYQTLWVLPFTVFASKEVSDFFGSNDSDKLKLSNFKLMISNVLQTNDRYDLLLNLTNKHNPDLLLTLESNKDWEHALVQLHRDYPYRVAVPLENLYGMHVYSKYPLEDTKVLYRVEDDIPSICTHLTFGDQQSSIELHFLHPKPPSPTEADRSKPRDEELIEVGQEVSKNMLPTIVAGDMNDVAWSRSIRLFKKLSTLNDPRVGRGFLNTFHVKYPLVRWPLDHIFVSKHFKINKFQVLSSVGSDHFPILIDLTLCSQAKPPSEKKPDELNPAEQDMLTERT